MTTPTRKRSISPRDLTNFRLLEDQVLSPDGRQVAFTVSTIEEDDLRYRSAIWITSTDGGESRQFTRGEQGDSTPRWRPDGGALAFISDRGHGRQVHILELTGAEPFAVTSFAAGVTDIAWSPDGNKLVVVSSGDESTDHPTDSRRITRLHYKSDGIGLLTEARNHLWLIDVASGQSPRQITQGDEDESSPAWSPDARQIAFNRTRPSVEGSAPFMDIWILDLETGCERNLTNGRGPCFGPTWSPDGSTLAFAGHTEPNDIWWGKNYGIWTVPAGGGEPREITAGFDRLAARAVNGDPWRGIAWPGAHWSEDGATLYFLVTDGGTCQVYSADAAGGNIRPVTHGRQVVTDLCVVNDVLLYGSMSSKEPTDLWLHSGDMDEPRQLTSLNGKFGDRFAVCPAELIKVRSFDGQQIDAWLISPVDLDPNGTSKHPLIISIHGGPHAAYGEAYHHSFQTFAGAGCFVLYVNPRGSQGYGETFARQCIGDWGGGDYRDLMAAIDHVVALGRVDEQRLGAWGASYGGFMTTWMAGQSDRFAAIVSVIPVTDLLSFYGTSDIGHYFAPFEMGCQPWEDRERYVRMSPLTYAPNVVTPLLLVHHEQDMRCPISQSEQYYTTLKSLGKNVEFVRISDASHGIVSPARAHAEVIGLEVAHEWFGHYLGF